MAITSDKLLNRPSELHRRYAGRLAMKEDLQKRMVQGGSTNIVLTKKSIKSIDIIKDRVIEIDSLFKGTLAVEKKKLDTQKRQEINKRREKEEEKLETKPQAGKGPIKAPSLPRMGFFAWVKNFIGNIILGYFAVRLTKFLPLAVPIVKFIGKATDFVIDIGGKLLDGLATFIDWGYKAYDATRGFMKNLFGEKQAKEFDRLSGALDQFLNLALIVGMATAGGGGFGKPGRGSAGRLRPGQGGRPGVTTSGGGAAGRPDIRNPLRERPKVTTSGGGRTGEMDVRNPFRSRPKITGSGERIRFPGKGAIAKGGLIGLVTLIPDIINSWDLWQNQGRGKDALRTFFSAAAGAAAGFATVAAVEAGAAALGLTGVGIPAAVALALAGFAASSLTGTGAYNVTDAILRRMGLVDSDPKTGKPYAYRGGGIARGGKSVGTPATRTIKKQKTKRTLKVQPTDINPGKSVGGKDKIKKIFPEVETKDKGKNVNPLGYMKSSYNKFSGIPGFGGLASLFMKAQLGERPSDIDYQNAAAGVEGWMQRTFSDEVLRTGGGFAEGGQVDAGMFSNDSDMRNMIAKSIQDSVAPKIDDTINDLMKQLGLKPIEVEKKDSVSQPSPGEDLGGSATDAVGGARLFMEAGFPPLAAAVLASVVQAESAWKGQRTPWVLNDGAGTNKGLISWNRGRITNAEKFLGKPLETASNGEQVKWIKEELKQYGLLDDMMNPQATEEQLKSAIYKYVGWDHRYDADHWKYISSIRSSLEKGDMGTYQAGPGGAGNIDFSGISKGKFDYNHYGFANGQVQYITGDTSQSKNYREDHGGGNYHDHLGFRDHATALKAFDFFKSKGFFVYEMAGRTSLSPRHQSKSDPHGQGWAFDIPAGQNNWPVGRENVGSAKVRSALKDFLSANAMYKGGRISRPSRILIAERGPEFVLDADTTSGLSALAPGLLEKLNLASTRPQLASILQSYTDYERPLPEVKYIQVPVPMLIPMGEGGESSGEFISMGGREESRSFDVLYKGG